ncbi:hypothetical protein SDC9_100482 [bioreactor metagenome]|uniref:Uncharacterized protein n=1 Tax=bioreactor metagenome TaxID=1076179 RepID=A0A645AS74_9ZZZZ
MCGRCTLTTTSAYPRSAASASFSRARCTWPREAAASGSSSNQAKCSASGSSSSARATSWIAANSSGGTWSCSPDSSSVISTGSTSSRADRNCPTLIIRPPIEIANTRKRAAVRALRRVRVRSASRPSPSRRRMISHQMKLAVTRAKNPTMRR